MSIVQTLVQSYLHYTVKWLIKLVLIYIKWVLQGAAKALIGKQTEGYATQPLKTSHTAPVGLTCDVSRQATYQFRDTVLALTDSWKCQFCRKTIKRPQ
jgi:hypothetical protein